MRSHLSDLFLCRILAYIMQNIDEHVAKCKSSKQHTCPATFIFSFLISYFNI